MANNVKIPLPGYGSPVGYSRKLVWAGDMFGSNNYQIGGYTLSANDFGMVGLEKIGVDFSGLNIAGSVGTYTAKITVAANISSNAEQQAPCFSTCTIKWYYSANNAEVANNTDLSAQGLRIDARGV